MIIHIGAVLISRETKETDRDRVRNFQTNYDIQMYPESTEYI